ncbi:MAG: DUF6984 family protein [Cytophagales bacterium]
MREIRQNEQDLIAFLLSSLGLDAQNHPFNSQVDEYEGGKMGSISLGGNPDEYDRDLIQVRYIDADYVPVIITLTVDSKNQLLDLDFWKEDFSKLLVYPTVEKVTIISQ